MSNTATNAVPTTTYWIEQRKGQGTTASPFIYTRLVELARPTAAAWQMVADLEANTQGHTYGIIAVQS